MTEPPSPVVLEEVDDGKDNYYVLNRLRDHQDNKESVILKLLHNGHKLENNFQEEALSFV